MTNSLSRRFFLRGAGASLLLPALPSLLPRTAFAAGETPIRYVQILSPYGPTYQNFYGGLSANQRISQHVNVGALPTGSWSTILGSKFNALKSKVTVLRGIDVLTNSQNHNYCFPTCASGYASGDGDEKPPQANQESIDVMLSKSSKVYAGTVPSNRRLVTINPPLPDDYSDRRSFSWVRGASGLQMLRPIKQTQAVFDLFSSGFGATTTPQPNDTRELGLIQSVFGEYKTLRDSGRMSAEDKTRLEAYLSLIRDIENDLKATPPPPTTTCNGPNRQGEGNIGLTITNQFRVLAAAMACDMTRVASITLGMSAGYNTRHTEHHSTNNPGLTNDYVTNATRISEFLGILDSVTEGGGKTMLDNSAVYCAYQYACMTGPDSHADWDMAVMLAGSAGGRLQHGNYVDLRVEGSGGARRPGVPINNVLVTLFNAMGLGSSDYEASAGQGYGLYVNQPPAGPAWGSRPNASMWQSTAGKRSPLPFIYSGPAMG